MTTYVSVSALLVVVLFSYVQTAPHGGKTRYDGYRVIRLVPNSELELKSVRDAANRWEELDFWKAPSKVGHFVDVMVPPKRGDVLAWATQSGINVKTLIHDVQSLIDAEAETLIHGELSIDDFDYTRYHPYEEIEAWMDEFAAKYNSIVGVETVSTTYEGRPLRAVRLGSPSGSPKPVAYIQGGIHAREWVSPATMMFMSYKLVEDYGVDATVTDMLDSFDWYIVPVLNPDGYVYTWLNDRMWRKNRHRVPGDTCTGIDLNRNYGYEWGGQGASKRSCVETYRGPGPLSEPELSGVTNFLLQKKQTNDVHLHMDIHSYGLYFLYPWGYTARQGVPHEDREKQKSLALTANEAITAVHGSVYFVGESGPDFYPAAGCSEDWGYGTLGAKYTYIMELRDEGEYGFILPEREIEPTVEEVYAAIKVIGERLVSEI